MSISCITYQELHEGLGQGLVQSRRPLPGQWPAAAALQPGLVPVLGVEVEHGGDDLEDVGPLLGVGGHVADHEVLDEALVHLARAVVRRRADLVLEELISAH